MRNGLQAGGITPPFEGDPFHSECAGREIIEDLTGRWSTLILVSLRDGPLRFSEVRERIDGISEKVLSQKLRTLVRDGFISRTVLPSTPPQVSYRLTELGRGVSQPLRQLFRWIVTHGPEVVAAQQEYDKRS